MTPTDVGLYLALFGATLLAGLLGLLIVFQAYRGYRRNHSSRMLYFAIGFAFLTLFPFAASLVGAAVAPSVRQLTMLPVLTLVNRLFEIVGLSIILYSLYKE